MDPFAYIETATVDQLEELREEAIRHLRARALVSGQEILLLIGTELWVLCVEEPIEGDPDPWGPLTEWHDRGYPSLRLSYDDLLDGFYGGPDGEPRFALRVGCDTGYLLRPFPGHPDPRVESVHTA